MPVISGLDQLHTRTANTVLVRSFFPRAKQWLYPELAGSYTSISETEPFSLLGAAPPLRRFDGQLKSQDLPAWKFQVPNLLFKNSLRVRQDEYEFDQTRSVVQLSQQIGIRLAEFPDQLFAARILKGSDPNEAKVDYKGQTYQLTFDGQPFFSENHDTYSGGTQSNIITGSLPTTKSALVAQDYMDSAKQMQRDIQNVIDNIKSVKDNQGVPIYPTISTRESVVVVVPPVLEPIATLAFRSNEMAGTNVVDQTTNVAPMFVRKVLSSGYLEGFFDPDHVQGQVAPPNPTDWYVFIVDDYVKPFYTQLFRPINQNEMLPPEGSADQVNQILNQVNGATVDQATLFASTRVDTTFRRIGADADAYTIETESFLMSARYRGNIIYGPWFTGWRIAPAGGQYDASSSSSSG